MVKAMIRKSLLALCAAALFAGLSVSTTAKPKELSKSVKPGDTVYFGRYEQDGNSKNKKEKIEWQVLDKKGDKILLFSKKVLDIRSYHKEFKEVTWEGSSLRKWLNKDFLKAAFQAEEIKKIRTTALKNNDNDRYGTKGGKATKDRVFLLSIDEANEYFEKDKMRTAVITKYAIKRISKESGRSEKQVKADWFMRTENMGYWLRSPGKDSNYAGSVENDGTVYYDSYSVDNMFGGVRPAVWVTP